MIIRKLVAHHLKHRDDLGFYRIQARDAVQWLQRSGVVLDRTTTALDLGAGSGLLGTELMKLGCHVTFADETNWLPPDIPSACFHQINIERDDLSTLGRYDLLICSNVMEHLADPDRLIVASGSVLKPGGRFYLSWTNWLSPWGGHDFSPFHYLGPRLGPWAFQKVLGRPARSKPFENLWPTYVGRTLRTIRRQPDLCILRMAPRYYTEFAFLMRLPVLREFLAWNCAVLIGKKPQRP